MYFCDSGREEEHFCTAWICLFVCFFLQELAFKSFFFADAEAKAFSGKENTVTSLCKPARMKCLRAHHRAPCAGEINIGAYVRAYICARTRRGASGCRGAEVRAWRPRGGAKAASITASLLPEKPLSGSWKGHIRNTTSISTKSHPVRLYKYLECDSPNMICQNNTV